MNTKIDKDLAKLYGIMLGDGCLSLVYERKKFIDIAGSLKEDIPFFEHVIIPILFRRLNKNINIKKRPKKRIYPNKFYK